jgi:hypothetical protein
VTGRHRHQFTKKELELLIKWGEVARITHGTALPLTSEDLLVRLRIMLRKRREEEARRKSANALYRHARRREGYIR